ncbi:MAG: hypothetical protein Q7U88_13265 [Desulfocapsaceae bacterium]|nr:hypothetical protein [Desulfocapsaceae bacterium]
MRLAQAVRVGAWLLVGLNLFMALGAIWILMRMAPAMSGIIERNDRSLYACEEMLAALVLVGDDMSSDEEQHLRRFEVALKRAQENVTEKGESAALKVIASSSPAAFAGSLSARQQMVSAIVRLGNINREAMNQADKRVRQFGEAGIWGVVFMAIAVFGVGLLFTRSLLRRVVTPMVELHAVITAYRKGETRRRCSGVDMPQEVRLVFSGINEILDQGQAQDLLKRDFTGDWRQDQSDIEK